jgi:hypothetical protein
MKSTECKAKKTKKILVRHCSECDHKLSDNQYSYSNGVCPYCGNDSGSTFVSIVRRVKEVEVIETQEALAAMAILGSGVMFMLMLMAALIKGCS